MSAETKLHEILKEYWGFDAFRPLQKEIALSVMEGKDTLALLPTGGGKSLCFQVPALALGGVCIVISPLIALMKDQVENLNKKGIRAAALYSGMHPAEISLVLNNAIHGGLSFLYLSPERLASANFNEYLQQMPIQLIAVDEAHCISQWGFDFRPEYRRILEVRQWLPKVPVIALTASATSKVVEDMKQQLGMKNPLFFRKSFERPNLSYIVRSQENKEEKMLQSVNSLKGSGLVYVRSRKKTESLAKYLQQHGINASFYHAGLEAGVRQQRQEDWIKNKTRIMVCTNAFGMGIDKPDCRLVIHYELPDSPEAYYQEAGRAGRDEQKAYCLLLYQPADAIALQQKLELQFPKDEVLRKVYDNLGSYLQQALGRTNDIETPFVLGEFSEKCKMQSAVVNAALHILSLHEFIYLSESVQTVSRIMFRVNGNQLFSFQELHPQFDELIKTLLRTYGGMFDQEVVISESLLAMKINRSEMETKSLLHKLNSLEIVSYLPATHQPRIKIIGPRLEAAYLKLNPELLKNRKAAAQEKLDAMVNYASNNLLCRSRQLLSYFDEKNLADCGFCDICLEKNKLEIPSEEQLNHLLEMLRKMDFKEGLNPYELHKIPTKYNQGVLRSAVRIFLDKGILRLNSQQKLEWC